MKKGNRIIKVFVTAIILGGLGLFQACVKYDNATIRGATLATYAIPGAGGYTQHNKPLIKLLELDNYGRALYRLQTKDDYRIDALFVTQKSDEMYIYYYDEACYICLPNNKLSENEAIKQLKLRNNWDESLDDSKMTRRVLNSKTDLFPQMEFKYYDQSKIAFEKVVTIPKGCNVWLQASDVSKTGQELYLASVFWVDKASDDSLMAWQKHYLMIISADGTYDPKNFIVCFDDLYKSNQPLAEVKDQNNWQN